MGAMLSLLFCKIVKRTGCGFETHKGYKEMIELFINKRKINADLYIYHHVANVTKAENYTLLIPLYEKPIIDFIEKYAGTNVQSSDLSKKIIHKNESDKSMGLMWKLKVHFFENISEHHSNSSLIIINNIKKIYIKNNQLVIEGQANS